MTTPTTHPITELDALDVETLADLDVDTADDVHGGYQTTGMSSAPMPS